MRRKEILGVILLAMFFIGCEKTEYLPSNGDGKIREIQNGSHEIIGKYTYNRDGELTRSWYIEDFYLVGERKAYSYSYDNKGTLICKKGYEPGIMYMSSMRGAMGKDVDYTYEYDDEGRIKTIRVDYDYDSEIDMDYRMQTVFEYPKPMQVIVSTNIIDPLGNSIAGYVEYNFDNKGNIENTKTYYMISSTEKRLSTKTEYTYDSKRAPFNNEPGLTSKHNVITESTTYYSYDENGVCRESEPSVLSYEYTYNSDDFPESKTETYRNGTKITKYFKY